MSRVRCDNNPADGIRNGVAVRAAHLSLLSLADAGTVRILLRTGVLVTRAALKIERYRRTRFWGLYEAGTLLCVTVYKKGAEAVKTRIERGAPLPPSIRALPSPEPKVFRRGRRAS